MYAIIRTGGRQFRVREGDMIAVERLDVDEGDDVTFDDVLLLGEGAEVRVGAPTVPGAQVRGRVQEQFRTRKTLSLKYKNKTRQRTLRGHRQQQTRVQITEISGGS